MPLLLIPLFVIVALVALIPFTIVQRYRVGTSRQRARGWLATINLVGLALSVIFFLTGAAITSYWVPRALPYSLAGFAGGLMLGIVGLMLTRWERSRGELYYTPNKLLVLALTLVITTRLAYGFWRSVHAWRLAEGDASWVASAGVAGSLAAGAVVLGYYLAYWIGVRSRYRRHVRS
jgi:hypothetical protein